MELDRAISQISEIHAHLLKSEVFRGYRAWPMAATGCIALIAAAMQDFVVWGDPGSAFAWYWLGCAAICAGICAVDLIAGLRRTRSATDRRRTMQAVLQFAPALAVGAVLTTAALEWDTVPMAALPGLWALAFSLGLFSSRLHMPRAAGWVAAWYLATGAVLLERATDGSAPSAWGMALSFGIGQLGLAWVLYANMERERCGSQAG